MGVAPISAKEEVLTPYDETKDIEFMTVKQSNNYLATPDRFFIFFPTDAHCPGLKVDENLQVKKVVIKVKVD
jgi:biofilm protein TabA